ncbi:hypothetical protein [Kytococcus sp. Marseille-QA3725]
MRFTFRVLTIVLSVVVVLALLVSVIGVLEVPYALSQGLLIVTLCCFGAAGVLTGSQAAQRVAAGQN